MRDWQKRDRVLIWVAVMWAVATIWWMVTPARMTQDDPRASVVRIEDDVSFGAAFAITPELLLTAAHVVEDPKGALVATRQDGVNRPVEVLWVSEGIDTALVRVRGLDLPPLPYSCRAPVVDEPINSVGHPLGTPWNRVWGHVSAEAGPKDLKGFTWTIPVDMVINQGNSGGPVMDGRGVVIGIADGLRTTGAFRSPAGMGLVTPMRLVCDLLARPQE